MWLSAGEVSDASALLSTGDTTDKAGQAMKTKVNNKKNFKN